MVTRTPAPVLDEVRPRRSMPLVKAVSVALSAFANKQHLHTELKNWRGDTKDAELIIRAATSPASLTQSRLGRHAGDDNGC